MRKERSKEKKEGEAMKIRTIKLRMKKTAKIKQKVRKIILF